MLLGRGGKILKQLPQGEPGRGSFEETEFELASLRAQMQISIQMLCLNLRTQMLTVRLLLVPPGGVIDERGFHLRIAPADHFCPCGNWFSLTIVWVQGTELELLGG